jgi:hypothetical protein
MSPASRANIFYFFLELRAIHANIARREMNSRILIAAFLPTPD